MLKVLFVDDSRSRISLVNERLKSSGLLPHISFKVCESADTARSELLEPVDFMVLDVLLPKKDNGIPQAQHSLDLLSDFSNASKPFIRPKMIIGLTADIERLQSHQSTFLDSASIVLDGSLNTQDWIDQLIHQIQIHVDATQKSNKLCKDQLLITVHGIRTHGKWQTELAAEIEKYSRSFDFIEVKYGYLDLLYFCFTKSRNRKADEIGRRLAAVIDKNQDKRISIVAHSFGTAILSQAFKKMPPESRVSNVIMCGSPLPESGSIDHIVDASDQTINECGISDTVLLLSKFFIPGLGYAGRVGFYRENTSRFRNRFFDGGHNLYFKKYSTTETFIKEHWASFLIGHDSITPIDCRPEPIFQDVTRLTARLFSKINRYFSLVLLLASVIIYFATR